MPTIQANGIELYYERSGSGPRLLYISGTGGDLRLKPGVSDGPLPARFDVLAYDQRGMGRAAKPDIPYSMADYADDAAGLMDAVGWDDARVIGVSFGGMVAQNLVAGIRSGWSGWCSAAPRPGARAAPPIRCTSSGTWRGRRGPSG